MKDLIDILLLEVGTKESPPNSNNVKYNTWFYNKPVSGPQYAWCGAFVSWGYNEFGKPLGNIGYSKGYAGCGTALEYFKKKGWIVDSSKAQRGDIFIVDWNGDNAPDHTGIFVQALPNGFFETIEGNTAIGNDSNGGEVMHRKDRKFIMGKAKFYFIHIP